MEKRKVGRPKSNKPTRDKVITIRVTESEFNFLQKICSENRVSYIDVLLNGLNYWVNK